MHAAAAPPRRGGHCVHGLHGLQGIHIRIQNCIVALATAVRVGDGAT